MRLNATFLPQAVSVSVDAASMGITLGDPVVKEYVNVDPYTGEYEVTPSAETQTLDTEGKRLTAPVVINPIPNNYGLISWNGSILTVS